MQSAYISHVGAVRENNEDAVFCDPEAGLFIAADGIGGRQAGEVASATAVHIAAEKFLENPQAEPAELLREAFYEANHVLYEAGKEELLDGMGTTMTAALIQGERIFIVHVGDSRAYLFNRHGIRQLTEDHSLVNELVREGKITAEEAVHHPRRNILTRSLGQGPLVEIACYEERWQAGDYLLLCTDGLYTLVSPEEMRELTMRAADIESAARFMADNAFNRGGYDNISLVLVSHD